MRRDRIRNSGSNRKQAKRAGAEHQDLACPTTTGPAVRGAAGGLRQPEGSGTPLEDPPCGSHGTSCSPPAPAPAASTLG